MANTREIITQVLWYEVVYAAVTKHELCTVYLSCLLMQMISKDEKPRFQSKYNEVMYA